MNDKKTLQKILLHLIKTRQTFCFLRTGELASIEDVLTRLYGREVTTEEAYKIYK